MKPIVAKESAPGLCAEALSVLFFGTIVAAANMLQAPSILFPEMGAVGSDVLLRPQGKWAKEPWKLIATPTITAVLGIGVGRALPYHVGTILLMLGLSVAILYALKSAVAPAISAGILPITLGVKSWIYPLAVFSSLCVLTAILWAWRQTVWGKRLIPDRSSDRAAVEKLESPVKARPWWLVGLALFVLVLGIAAQLSTWRFILFPPLIVMAYEMLAHPDTCPWAKPPYTFPIVCTFAGGVGVGFVEWLGITPISSGCVLAITFAALKVSRLRMPPTLAVGLIPFVVPNPSWRYVASVGIGTLSLTLWFLAFRALSRRIQKLP